MYVSPWKRRILVIPVQYRLLTGNLLYLATVVFAFGVVLLGPIAPLLLGDAAGLPRTEVTASELLVMQERVWFAIPVLMALCILHAAVVSNRVAGPLYRFRQVFGDLANGDLTLKINLRRHDYLRPEAELMAEMVDSLRERMEAIRHGYQQASATLPLLMGAVGRGANEEAAVVAGELGTQMDALGEQIRWFRIARSTEADLADQSIEPWREKVPTASLPRP